MEDKVERRRKKYGFASRWRRKKKSYLPRWKWVKPKLPFQTVEFEPCETVDKEGNVVSQQIIHERNINKFSGEKGSEKGSEITRTVIFFHCLENNKYHLLLVFFILGNFVFFNYFNFAFSMFLWYFCIVEIRHSSHSTCFS